MATTTNYDIFYPVATDAIAPLHTAFSTLATSVDDALSDPTTGLTGINSHLQNYHYTVANDALRAAITGMTPGSRCFVTGTKGEWVYDGTAWKLMNQPWTAHTITAISGVTFDTAQYCVTGGRVNFQVKLSRTGTIASAQLTLEGLPTSSTILSPYSPIGQGILVRLAGTDTYFPLTVTSNSSTSVKLWYEKGTAAETVGPVNLGSTTAPTTFALNDYVVAEFSYQLA